MCQLFDLGGQRVRIRGEDFLYLCSLHFLFFITRWRKTSEKFCTVAKEQLPPSNTQHGEFTTIKQALRVKGNVFKWAHIKVPCTSPECNVAVFSVAGGAWWRINKWLGVDQTWGRKILDLPSASRRMACTNEGSKLFFSATSSGKYLSGCIITTADLFTGRAGETTEVLSVGMQL